MSVKKPVNLTINTKVLDLADKVMDLRGHSSLSGFVEELIRAEYEKRLGLLTLDKKDTTPAVDAAVSEIVEDAIATRATPSKRPQAAARSSKRPAR